MSEHAHGREGHYRMLEKMYAVAPINQYYAPRMKVSHGAAEVVIPIQEKFFHAAGAAHGSVYFKAMDDAAFFAVNSLVDDFFVLTATFSVYLIRPISGGEMRAVGTVVHKGGSFFIAESVLYDSEQREIARGNGTFVKSKTKLAPELGYRA
ncbi:MAG TPA: PaaI family thioesterase [Terriglobales bacterium]|nr:PaaI family thioesterase [Terriglobales bacterium]